MKKIGFEGSEDVRRKDQLICQRAAPADSPVREINKWVLPPNKSKQINKELKCPIKNRLLI